MLPVPTSTSNPFSGRTLSPTTAAHAEHAEQLLGHAHNIADGYCERPPLVASPRVRPSRASVQGAGASLRHRQYGQHSAYVPGHRGCPDRRTPPPLQSLLALPIASMPSPVATVATSTSLPVPSLLPTGAFGAEAPAMPRPAARTQHSPSPSSIPNMNLLRPPQASTLESAEPLGPFQQLRLGFSSFDLIERITRYGEEVRSVFNSCPGLGDSRKPDLGMQLVSAPPNLGWSQA